jgi:hypothetical protein
MSPDAAKTVCGVWCEVRRNKKRKTAKKEYFIFEKWFILFCT